MCVSFVAVWFGLVWFCIQTFFNTSKIQGWFLKSQLVLQPLACLNFQPLELMRLCGVPRGSPHWSHAEMPGHLSVLSRTRQKHDAMAFGGLEGQLVESEGTTPSLTGVTVGLAAHPQCIHLHLRHF